MPRRMTSFGVVPLTIKPPIRTLSPVPTISRVEILSWRAVTRTDPASLGSVCGKKLREVARGIAIGVAGRSAELRILDLVEREARGLKTGEIDLRRNPDAGDKRIGISRARIDPDRDRGHIGAGRGRDPEIIAEHVTAGGQRGEAGVGRFTR